MKFRLNIIEDIYTKEDALRLQSLGFKMIEDQPDENGKYGFSWFTSTNQEHKWKVDDGRDQVVDIEIGSMDDLLSLGREWGRLIVDVGAQSITIYNGYAE
jgi:hypothetical protein